MDRRDFLKTTAVAVSMAAAGSVSNVFASQAVFAGVLYTKDNPGMWAAKVGSHVPQVKVEGSTVTVTTAHGMSESHFIVRQTLVLENGEVVGAKTFTPADTPSSTYELPAGYKGKFFATSFCNQHDFWLTEMTV